MEELIKRGIGLDHVNRHMSESVLAASDFSLETSWKQAEKGTLSPFECLSFANTIQGDLLTCGYKTVNLRG